MAKKTEKATLFLTPFYVSDKILNRSWAILSSEKKVEVLNPQLKSWILSTYTSTTFFWFYSFWWRDKFKLPIFLPSQSIGRRKCHLFDEEICGHFCYQKMRWWVAFDFDQVNWKNNFALYLILSFRQKFGLFLKQRELSKKDETFNPQFKSVILNIYAFTTLNSNILRYRFWDTTCYTCVKDNSFSQKQVT